MHTSSSPYRSFPARPIASYGARRPEPQLTTYQSRTLPGFTVSGNALKPTLSMSALHKHRPLTARMNVSGMNSSLRGSRENVHPLRRVATARRVKSARSPGGGRLSKNLDSVLDNHSPWITITKYKKGLNMGAQIETGRPLSSHAGNHVTLSELNGKEPSLRQTDTTTSTTTSFLPQVPVVIVKRAGLLSARSRVGERDPSPVKQSSAMGTKTGEAYSSAESLHASSSSEEEYEEQNDEWGHVNPPSSPDICTQAETPGVNRTPSPVNGPPPEPAQWAQEPELPPVTPTKAPTAAVDPSETDLSFGFSGSPGTEEETIDFDREQINRSITPGNDPSPNWPNEAGEQEESVFLTSVPKESVSSPESNENEKAIRRSMVIPQVQVSIEGKTSLLKPQEIEQMMGSKLSAEPSDKRSSAKHQQAMARDNATQPSDVTQISEPIAQSSHNKAILRPKSSHPSPRTRADEMNECQKDLMSPKSGSESNDRIHKTRARPVTAIIRSSDSVGTEINGERPKRAVSFADIDTLPADEYSDLNKEYTQPIKQRPKSSRMSSARVRSRQVRRDTETGSSEIKASDSDSGVLCNMPAESSQEVKVKLEGVQVYTRLDALTENPLSPDTFDMHIKEPETLSERLSPPVTISRPKTGRLRSTRHNTATIDIDKEDTPTDEDACDENLIAERLKALNESPLSSSIERDLHQTSGTNNGVDFSEGSDGDSIPDDTNSEGSDLDDAKICMDHFRYQNRPKTGRTATRHRTNLPDGTRTNPGNQENDTSRQPVKNQSRAPLADFSNSPTNNDTPHYNSPTEQFSIEIKKRPRTAAVLVSDYKTYEPLTPLSTKRASTGTNRTKTSRKSSSAKHNKDSLDFISDPQPKSRSSTGKMTRAVGAGNRPKTSVFRNKSGNKHRMTPGAMTVVLSVANILLNVEDETTSRVKEFQNRILKFYTAILREESTYKRKIARLPEFQNIRVQAITLGSIKLHCLVQTLDALDRLEKSYLSTDLAQVLTDTLLTPQVLQEIGVQKMDLVADIDQKDLLRCKHDLAARSKKPSLTIRGRPPAITRTRSDPSICAKRRSSINSSEISLESAEKEFMPRTDCMILLKEGAEEFTEGVTIMHNRYEKISASSNDFMMTLKLVKPVKLKEFKYLADVIAVYNYLEASPSVGKSLPTQLVNDFLAIVNLSHQYLKDITAKVRTIENHILKYIKKDSIVDFYRKILDFRDLLDPSFLFASIESDCPFELSIMDSRLFSKLMCYLPFLLENLDELVERLIVIQKEISLQPPSNDADITQDDNIVTIV